MSLREPNFRPANRHVKLVLDRLHRETTASSRQTISFRTLCTAVSIPHDLRARLLQTLLAEGYVTREDDDEIRLTKAGTKLATSPLT
jgi:DNA-binding IclR family transcriptional regulator